MKRREALFDPSEDINLTNNIDGNNGKSISTIPTLKLDQGIEDRSKEKTSGEITESILNEMKNNKVILTEEQKKEYDLLETEEEKRLYVFQLLRSTNFGKLDKSLDDLGKDLDKILNRDRMDITEDEIADLIRPMSSEEAFAEQTKTYTDLFNKVFNTIRKSYVEKRNRYIDGQLDGAIDIEELGTIRGLIEKYFKSHPEFVKKFTDSYKLRELSVFFNDMNIESRMRYELNKEIAANVYGIDPDSFDTFMNAVYEKQREYLKTVGIDKPTDLQKVYDKHALECKHLLVKIPNAKEIVSRGEFIYKSSFLEAANKAYLDEIKDYQKYATKKSVELWTSMASDLFNDPIKYRERKKKEKENNKGIEIETRRAHSKTEVNTFMESIKNKKKELKEEVKSIGYTDKKDDSSENNSIMEEKEIKKEVEDFDFESLINKNEEKEIEKDQKENPKDLIDVVVDQPSSNKPQNDLINETISENSENTLKDIVLKESNELKIENKPKVNREFKDGFDNYFNQNITEADTSILKTSLPTHIKMKAYRESHKVTREIYLPNSNYSVKVKRIEDYSKLNYMLSLLQDFTDVDTDLTVKYELINTLYGFLEFDQDVSFSTFLKSTHESDLSLLFMMLAIMNIREKDNKIPFNITYLLCQSCDSIVYLKDPITLDLKSEFMRIYPVNKYIENRSKYISKEYPSLEHAYRDSEVGKLFVEKYSDDLFEYKIIYSLPTLYKKYTTLNEEYQIAYRVALEQLEESDNLDNKSLELLDFAKEKSYLELLTRYKELKNANIMSVNSDILDGEDKVKYNNYKEEYNKISSLLSVTENLKNILTPLFSMLFSIDVLTITAIENNEVIDKLSHNNIYGMIQTLSNLPENILSNLTEKILNKLDEDSKISVNTNIILDSTELEGKLEWEKVYQFDRELNQVVSEDQIIENFVKNNPNVTPDEIENRRLVRKLMKERIEKGKCSCGGDKLYVNYTNLLFFSLSSR